MRIATIVIVASVGLISVYACSKSDQASNPPAAQAAADFKTAGSDLAQAASDAAPAVKAAGADVVQGTKDLAAAAAPAVKKAGDELGKATEKAGDEIKSTADKAGAKKDSGNS